MKKTYIYTVSLFFFSMSSFATPFKPDIAKNKKTQKTVNQTNVISQSQKSDLDYFPISYYSALNKFKKIARAIIDTNVTVTSESIAIPSKTDKDLEINYLNIPAQQPGADLIVLTSGVHGAEAYTGSAVQQMFLNEILPQADLNKIGFLIIHSINPYGFKHFRRVDENNVDLNRNFPTNYSLYSMENQGYESLSSLLGPTEPVKNPNCERVIKDLNLLQGLALGKYSVKEIGDAIGQGQHKFPKGLEYGGISPESQVLIVKEIVEKWSSQYRRIIFFDIHTGLGSKNQLHMMTGDGVAYKKNPLLQKILPLNVDGNNYDLATGDDPGFYPTPGDIINYLPTLFTNNQETLALTAEFGTIGTGTLNQIKTLNRLVLENQGFHYGYSDQVVQRGIEHDFHQLFLPEDPIWRTLVIEKARYVLTNIIDRLGDLKK